MGKGTIVEEKRSVNLAKNCTKQSPKQIKSHECPVTINEPRTPEKQNQGHVQKMPKSQYRVPASIQEQEQATVSLCPMYATSLQSSEVVPNTAKAKDLSYCKV